MTKREYLVAEEVALSEFYRFLDAMDIIVDEAKLDQEDTKAFKSARDDIVLAIRLGRLVIDDHGQPVYTPVMGSGDELKPITFHEPTGATFMAMDRRKKDESMAKTFAAMADATRESPDRFAKMRGRDIKVCTAIFNLFF